MCMWENIFSIRSWAPTGLLNGKVRSHSKWWRYKGEWDACGVGRCRGFHTSPRTAVVLKQISCLPALWTPEEMQCQTGRSSCRPSYKGSQNEVMAYARARLLEPYPVALRVSLLGWLFMIKSPLGTVIRVINIFGHCHPPLIPAQIS